MLNVKDRLARIEGVGQVLMLGSGDYSMRVWLDPRKVAERGLSAGDVVRAIRQENVQAAAGVVGGSPATNKVDLQLSINAQGRLQTEEEFGDIIVKSEPGGAVTRLRDIARIELGASEYALRSLLDNKPAVAIGIFAAPGANALQISDNVRRTMGEIKKSMPEGVDYEIVYDPTQFVRASIKCRGEDAARGDGARGAGGDPVPADLARLDHPAGGGAGVDRRHVLAPVSASASRSTRCRCSAWCSPSASWWTTPSWWWRTSSATSPPGLSPREATYRAMHEVTNPIIAIALGAGGGVRAARLHQRPVGPVLQAVRADHRDLDRHLGDQLAHPLARARRAAAQAARRTKDALTRWIERLFGWLFRGFNRVFGRGIRAYSRSVAGVLSRKALDAGHLRRPWSRPPAGLFKAVPDGFVPSRTSST